MMRALDIIGLVVMLAAIGLVIHNGFQISNLEARVARLEARQPNLTMQEDHRALTTRSDAIEQRRVAAKAVGAGGERSDGLEADDRGAAAGGFEDGESAGDIVAENDPGFPGDDFAAAEGGNFVELAENIDQNVRANPQEMRREIKRQTRDRMLERFAQSARLTQDQMTAFKQSVEVARQRKNELYAAVRSGDLPAQNASSELQLLNQTFHAGLKGILDAEQYSRYVAMSKRWRGERIRRRGGGRRPGGAARAGQPR